VPSVIDVAVADRAWSTSDPAGRHRRLARVSASRIPSPSQSQVAARSGPTGPGRAGLRIND